MNFKYVALLLLVLLATSRAVNAQSGIAPGPDPRTKPFRPFKPRERFILTIQVETIERGVPSKTITSRIKRLEEKIERTRDRAQREQLEERVDRILANLQITGDWIVVGKQVKGDQATLRVSREKARHLGHLEVGDFVRTVDPTPDELSGVYLPHFAVRKIARPSWWTDAASAPTSPRVGGTFAHRTIRQSWPTSYLFHDDPLIEAAADESLPDVIARVAPAVFTLTTAHGSGTGFVINEEGIAITNEHVIRGARSFDAEFSDGRIVKGVVVGVADGADLALLDLSGADYPYLLLESDNDLRVGESVFAVGAPLEFSHTVSQGIVSGLREIYGLRALQTDAAINPGNSGGPILRRSGKVVGVATWKRVDAEGLGFAISIAEALTRFPLRAFQEADAPGDSPPS